MHRRRLGAVAAASAKFPPECCRALADGLRIHGAGCKRSAGAMELAGAAGIGSRRAPDRQLRLQLPGLAWRLQTRHLLHSRYLKGPQGAEGLVGDADNRKQCCRHKRCRAAEGACDVEMACDITGQSSGRIGPYTARHEVPAGRQAGRLGGLRHTGSSAAGSASSMCKVSMVSLCETESIPRGR